MDASLRNRKPPSLLALVLLIAVLVCTSLLAVEGRRYRQLSRYVVLITRMKESREKGEHRMLRKTRCAEKNSTSPFFFSSTNNSEFPGLNDDAPESLSTSATECDNTETGL